MESTAASAGAVLVTGASTGIGHATALLLAQEGYAVYAGVRKEHDRERLAALHSNIHPLTLDVTVAPDVERAMTALRNAGVPLRAVVNNAGIAVAGPLEYLPLDELRRQFEVNVFAPVAVAQAALPLLRESGGRIVFIGSIAGRMSAPFVGPYSASKAALASLADALRQELATGSMAVSLLEFAAVKTPIWAKGRAESDGLIASLPPAALERYGAEVDAVVAQTRLEERRGMEPLAVAKTVLAALRAKRPRERYVIGTQAKIQSVVALFPARTRDRLVRKAMRLP